MIMIFIILCVCIILCYFLVCLSGILYIEKGLKAYRKRHAYVKYRDIKFSWHRFWTFPVRHVLLDDDLATKWGIGQIISGSLLLFPPTIVIFITQVLNISYVISPKLSGYVIFVSPIVGLGLHYIISQIYGRKGNRRDIDDDNMHTNEVNEKLKNIDDDVHSGIDPFYESKHQTK